MNDPIPTPTPSAGIASEMSNEQLAQIIEGPDPMGEKPSYTFRNEVARRLRLTPDRPKGGGEAGGTPLTDAAVVESILCTEGGDEECTVYPVVEHVEADFARELERKLSAPPAPPAASAQRNESGARDFVESWKEFAAEIYATGKASGFYDGDFNHGEKIALMHSELSEALEGLRKDLMDDHLPHRKMVECEMADTIIRIMNYCTHTGLDVASAVIEKNAYNRTRGHKHGNKKF